MKTFGKSIIVFLIFFVGTLSVIHVDRQGARMSGTGALFTETIENFIEK